MGSISFKLTAAFFLVGFTGAILVAAISLLRTAAAFNQFILNREQQILVDNLIEHYQIYGNWNKLGNLQDPTTTLRPLRPFENNRNPQGALGTFTVVAADGKVVYSFQRDQIGQTVPNRTLQRAIALESGGRTVGWLLLAPTPRNWGPATPERLFLKNITSATVVSALVAAAMALVLGGMLAFTLTRSLRELTDATMAIAAGKLGLQVKVRSKDEVGELASSFNKMSLDLELATRVRRQMTADIAHDLRSPLSIISGYAEALSDGKLPGTAETYNILHQETQHLNHLVEDLRTLSLADAGELTLNLQPIHPETILQRQITRHAMAARQRDISLRMDVAQNLPLVTVDPERMAQILDNLIINAFRYTPNGGEIVLAAGTADKKVWLQIRDNGRGIASEDLPNIFDRFYRGDKSRHQNGESGLGLAIAKSIIEAQAGTIEVESHPGQGASFTIKLDQRDL